jgi:hypothetical protein
MRFQTTPLLILPLLALLAACAAETPPEAPAPDPADIAAAQAAAQAVGQRLKARLMEAVAEEGPAAAIGVCSDEAPEIAAAVSAEAGLSVGRTALRVRNPANAPDAYERAQLMAFEDALSDGADPATLSHAAVVEGTFRWMKPIIMQQECTLCHGAALPDAVAAAVAARYPEDAATGFAPGDLRGAFTVMRRLDAE